VVVTLVVGCGVVLFGWRNGFRPLPHPVPGGRFRLAPAPAWSEITTNNWWYWVRESGRQVDWEAPSTRSARDWLDSWLEGGPRRVTRIEPWAEWSSSRPEIGSAFRAALACVDDRRPQANTSDDLSGVSVLVLYALGQAATSASQQQAVEALRHLIATWRFQAPFASCSYYPDLYDERRGEQVNDWVGRPWRRLVLTGPAVPAAEARQLLYELAAVTNSLPSLEVFYARLVTQDPSLTNASPRPDWAAVRSAFQLSYRQSADAVWGSLERLRDSVLGLPQRPTARPAVSGSLRRPLSALVQAIQRALARPEDFERMRDAYLSHVLARIRQGRVLGVEAERAWRRSWSRSGAWTRALDRPLVWRSIENYPDPALLAEDLNWWRVCLESCRLTLALRVYRECHGAWPQQLADLVPDNLPALPLDPFTGEPFRYSRAGNNWQFWSRGSGGKEPRDDEPEHPPQRLFRSTEAWPAQ
jgi:hypothetical protein